MVLPNYSDHLKNHLDDFGKTLRNRAVLRLKGGKQAKRVLGKWLEMN